MRLTEEQQRKVSENIRLVQKVINDKVHGPVQLGIYSYEDIFQIGCIGLCKAAATDKGGTFSTYAYRLIWNEICDALIYATRRQATETASDILPLVLEEPGTAEEDLQLEMDIRSALEAAGREAFGCVVKGIEAMVKMSRGYTSREIAEEHGVSAKHVCAWISKARKYLKNRPEIRTLQNG